MRFAIACGSPADALCGGKVVFVVSVVVYKKHLVFSNLYCLNYLKGHEATSVTIP